MSQENNDLNEKLNLNNIQSITPGTKLIIEKALPVESIPQELKVQIQTPQASTSGNVNPPASEAPKSDKK